MVKRSMAPVIRKYHYGSIVSKNTSINAKYGRNGSKRILSDEKRFGDNKSDFSWGQVFLQWALGLYVSTPIIAILQGSFLLNDYRANFSNAPRPITPARGVAVAIDDSENENNESQSSFPSWIFHPFSASNQYSTGPSIRLLVVGDSLAAGVGVSNSGVPILPESIARALSKALGGRTVYWTCYGTPGISAKQIVENINEIEPYDPHPKGRQLERIVKEFQIRRRLWQQRHKNRSYDEDGGDVDTRRNKDQGVPQNLILEWWKQIQQHDLGFEEGWSTTKRLTSDWCKQVRCYRKRIFKEELSAIRDIILNPSLPTFDDDDDGYFYDYYRESIIQDSIDLSRNPKHNSRIPISRQDNEYRRSSLNPEVAAEYDVAVVLTGLNDVKEAFMPRTTATSVNNDNRNLRSTLRQILEALRNKMREMNIDTDEMKNNDDNNDCINNKKAENEPARKRDAHRPLVVVPELPVEPLEIFQLVPLCWFLLPIFRAMENNKRFLASSFPEYVVFVHQPDLCWWSDNTEMGIGSIRENIKQERLLLRVTDCAKKGRKRIEKLMKQFYGQKHATIPTHDESSYSSQHNCTTKQSTPLGVIDNDIIDDRDDFPLCSYQLRGGDLISADKIHPNDEGYELWGRYIAAAIIEHWNQTSSGV